MELKTTQNTYNNLCGTELWIDNQESIWGLLNTPTLTCGGEYRPNIVKDNGVLKTVIRLPSCDYLIIKDDGEVVINEYERDNL